MMARLDGKVAIILGASDPRSMGAATARRSSAGPASRIPPRHRSPPQPEVSHDSDGFTQGDKPC